MCKIPFARQADYNRKFSSQQYTQFMNRFIYARSMPETAAVVNIEFAQPFFFLLNTHIVKMWIVGLKQKKFKSSYII